MSLDVPAVFSLALPGLGVLAVVTARGAAGTPGSPEIRTNVEHGSQPPAKVKPGRRRNTRKPGKISSDAQLVDAQTDAPAARDANREHATDTLDRPEKTATEPRSEPISAAVSEIAEEIGESAANKVTATPVEAVPPTVSEADRSSSESTRPPITGRYTRTDRVEATLDGLPAVDRRPAFNPVPARRPVNPAAGETPAAPAARVHLVHVPDDLSTLEAVDGETGERAPDATGTARATWAHAGVLGDLSNACHALEAAWRSGDAEAVAAVAAHERALAWVAWVAAACVDPNPSRPRYVGLAWRTLKEAVDAAGLDLTTAAGRDHLAATNYAALLPAEAANLFSDLRVIVDVAGTPIRVDMPASATALAYAQAAVAAANGDLLSLDDLLATLPTHPLGSLLEAVADEFDQDRYVVGAMRQDAWGLVFAHLGLLRIAKTRPHDAPAITAAADRVRELLVHLSPDAAAGQAAPGERALETSSGTLVISDPDGSRLRVRVRDLVTDGVYWQAWAASRRNEPRLARTL
ncbi:hypothetical protein, partial [Paenarthrobacter sp. C1]|uniref:hypothetical protein n=1 Tax=Paenarthrobacter sp. C1 TaxID=3400220 RepID=UPI003BF559E5